MISFRKDQSSRMLGRGKSQPETQPEPAQPEEPPCEPAPASAPESIATKRPGPDREMDAPTTPASPAPAAPGPLHVALDVRFWEMSGLGTFERELVTAFARLALPLRFTLIGPEKLREQMPSGLSIARWIDFDAPIYSPRSLFGYPRLRDVDLFHYPHYNLPLARARHRVVNVFDLFHLKYGNLPRRMYMRWLLRRLRWAGRRTTLVTASDKVSRELARAAHLHAERITRIYPGPGRLPPPARPPRAEVKSLTGQPLRGPWLLATGIDQPHKNFDFLLSALSLFYQRRPDAPPFVWVGLSEEDRQRRLRQLPAMVRQRVALEPYTSPERMEALLSGSIALVFPSLDEGFGFPPLEAMARGVPVLCARREPMTRQLGNAPLWFEPAESASLWRMLDRLVDSEALCAEQIELGFEIAKFFQWDRAALHYFELYRKIVAA